MLNLFQIPDLGESCYIHPIFFEAILGLKILLGSSKVPKLMAKTMEKAENLHFSAIFIQTFFRATKERRYHDKIQKAVKIQAVFRGWKTRKKLGFPSLNRRASSLSSQVNSFKFSPEIRNLVLFIPYFIFVFFFFHKLKKA